MRAQEPAIDGGFLVCHPRHVVKVLSWVVAYSSCRDHTIDEPCEKTLRPGAASDRSVVVRHT